jgi:hypothetical protein
LTRSALVVSIAFKALCSALIADRLELKVSTAALLNA